MDMAELCHVRNDAGDGGHQRRHWGTQGGFRGWRNPWVQAGSSKGGCPQGLHGNPFPFLVSPWLASPWLISLWL